MPGTVRLPVLRLLGQALRDVFGNLGGLARIAWPYYGLAAASAVLGFAPAGGSPVADAAALVLGPGTVSILTGLALLACTVKWQRHVILAEPLVGIAPLNGRVLRYSLWSVLISLLCALPVLAGLALALFAGLIGADPTGEAAFRIGLAGILVCVAAGLAGFLLVVRLILVLPAVSVDDRPLTLAASWRLTQGNALRLLAALLLLALGLALLASIMALVQAALEQAASDPGHIVPSLTGIVLRAAVNLVASMGAASLIARAYRLLVADLR